MATRKTASSRHGARLAESRRPAARETAAGISRLLAADKLRWTADPARLPPVETDPADPLRGIIGQERALSALRFGLGIREPGFNLYVAGPPGIGKMTAVEAFLETVSKSQAVPPDLCYVHNFADPHRPILLRLPAGQGAKFKAEMERLIDHLRREIPKAFASEAYSNKRDAIVASLQRDRAGIVEDLTGKALKAGFALEISPWGMLLNPLKEGKPLEEGDYSKLSAGERRGIEMRREALEKELKEGLQTIHELQARVRERLEELDRGVVDFVLGGLIQGIRRRYSIAGVGRYLDAVSEDLLRSVEFLKRGGDEKPEAGSGLESFGAGPSRLRKYAVNLLVDNSGLRGAPVVVEWNPTFLELFGRAEKESRLGTLTTDLTLLKSGALHRANGGYLVLPAEALLRSPLSWEALKAALRAGQARIEDPEARLGWFAARSLAPEPMALDVKIILIGGGHLYQLLHAYDEEFPELFRVRVDFDTRIPRDARGVSEILAFLALLSRKENLRPMEPEAAALFLEHAARLSESQDYLSTHFGALAELVREASHWAGEERSAKIGCAHVRRALAEKVYRAGLVESQVREMIRRGTLLISVTGRALGQVNGLGVVDYGGTAFGKPSRITASVGPGREGVMDIEREVELSGPIHSKGVLILNGYLVHRYAQTRPLTLTARLVFEQSYAGVEGDSASSAELYALLSSLSGLAVRQGIAVTGSINQHGEIQAIGGVNEKVEGFFDVCRLKGLTGDQGVIIPWANRSDPMLREDVVEAARKGLFHVWAVRTVDEGIEILTGVAAGSRGPAGLYTPGSVNFLVERQLERFAVSLRQDGNPAAAAAEPAA